MENETKNQVEEPVVADNSEAKAPEVVENAEAPVVEQDTKTFLDFVPDEYKDIKSLESFKDKPLEEALPALLKSYTNAQTLIGKKVAELPKDELKAIVDFPDKPKDAEGYKNAIQDIDMELVEEFAPDLHEMGFSIEQAKVYLNKIAEKRANTATQEVTAQEELKEAAEKALQEKFGLKYKAALDIAGKAALDLGGTELYKKVMEKDIKDPEIVEALYKAGMKFLTPETIPQVGPLDKTPDEARIEKDKLLADPDFRKAYMSQTHPEHAAAVKKMRDLYREIGG